VLASPLELGRAYHEVKDGEAALLGVDRLYDRICCLRDRDLVGRDEGRGVGEDVVREQVIGLDLTVDEHYASQAELDIVA